MSEAHAQQTTLSISPSIIEAIMKPDRSILVAYNFSNLGDPNIIQLKVRPFVPKDSSGKVQIKEEFEGPIRFSLDNSDIELEKPFFMKTRDTQQVLLRIRTPEGAPEGDYYYTLIAETQAPPISEGFASSRAKASIGTNIVLTVTDSGKIDVNGRIKSFEVLPRYKLNFLGKIWRIFDSGDKIPVVLTAQNQGKNLIKPEGEILLRGGFGETARYEVVPENILAYSERVLRATPSAEFASNEPVSLVLTGFFMGNYRLSSNLSFGEGGASFTASTKFTVLPIRFMIGAFIALGLAVVILKKIKETRL